MSRTRQKAAGSAVRIIAGRWRGRRISVAPEGVRPTGDRVRETLFNWLQPVVVGARCLDLFAGTGALGIEALSRGADHVVFVEQNAKIVSCLRETLDAFECEACLVLQADALGADLTAQGPFDLVFLDPPFGSLELGNLCTLLESPGYLADSALVYVEMPREQNVPELPSGWCNRREGTAGGVRFALLERTAGDQNRTATGE